jgi:SAM-dependent methyltransferase
LESQLTNTSLRTLLETFEQDIGNVIDEISPDDPASSAKNPQMYFASGKLALEQVQLALLAARKANVDSILDFPCGWGRVLRFLKAGFPTAALTVCDIHQPAVDFCANTFDATPILSKEDPLELEIQGQFDLIWCGSLLTHVDRELWSKFLTFFESLLVPEGILVFTTHGRYIADEVLRACSRQMALRKEQVEALLHDYDRDGFAYSDYPVPPKQRPRARSHPEHYGVSLSSPAWVSSELTKLSGIQLLTYSEGGYGTLWASDRMSVGTSGHDFVGCVKTRVKEAGAEKAPAEKAPAEKAPAEASAEKARTK